MLATFSPSLAGWLFLSNLALTLKYVSTLLVHELEPKKWVFCSGGSTKHNITFQSPQGVYFLEKYDELPKLAACRWYFTDQNGPKGGSHENEF